MLRIADKTFESHLFTGTGKFAAPEVMVEAIRASGSQLVTLAMKRVDLRQRNDAILAPLLAAGVSLLPNTSGAKTAEEAVFAARLAREALGTHWLKLEIHPDARWLLPDPIETLKAAELLVREGFVVLPYCGADPVLCKRLEEVGCAAVMPLGAPIGSNQGLETKAMLEIIIQQATVLVVVDAGIGVPSHAAQALEMGENNACMKCIVAAPTAGSCGVLPAVLLPYQQREGLSDEAMVRAMYVAGAIGQVVAAKASIAGAAGGCQAEIGTASAMGAAALCYLGGGSSQAVCHAAAIAIKSMLGLVCDPIAGLVEVPCVKRNAAGAMIAMSSADMALAGIRSAVPPDEVILAMREVGDKMDVSLKETGVGGVAGTPFGQKIAEKMGVL